MPAILDSGAVYALADAADPAHGAVAASLGQERAAIVVPAPVLVEVCQLLERRHGPAAEAEWLRRLVGSGWAIEALDTADLTRAADLLARYASVELGFVDAAIVAIAERLGAERIYTLDRRDFSIVRPAHVPAFTLLP